MLEFEVNSCSFSFLDLVVAVVVGWFFWCSTMPCKRGWTFSCQVNNTTPWKEQGNSRSLLSIGYGPSFGPLPHQPHYPMEDLTSTTGSYLAQIPFFSIIPRQKSSSHTARLKARGNTKNEIFRWPLGRLKLMWSEMRLLHIQRTRPGKQALLWFS